MPLEVGHRFPPRRFRVEAVKVEEFVTALGVAPQAGYTAVEGARAPLGYLMYVTTYGAEPVHAGLDLDMLRTVYGGADLEVLRPIVIGETLTVKPVLTGLTQKEGSAGPLLFCEITTDYELPDGVVALRERSTTIERG